MDNSRKPRRQDELVEPMFAALREADGAEERVGRWGVVVPAAVAVVVMCVVWVLW